MLKRKYLKQKGNNIFLLVLTEIIINMFLMEFKQFNKNLFNSNEWWEYIYIITNSSGG